MSTLPKYHTPGQSRMDGAREPTLSLPVRLQVYAGPQADRVWARDAAGRAAHVRRWDESTPHRAASGRGSPDGGQLGQRGGGPPAGAARPAPPCRDGRTRRGVYLCRAEKNKAYIVTEVDRATRCIIGWDVVWERDVEALQEMIERARPAQHYWSDAFPTYARLVYWPGHHAVAPGKSQTYSVEADNAELRHYLARLRRCSRCFSRSIAALRRLAPPCAAPSGSSATPGTVVNSTAAPILTMPAMSCSSYAHYLSHSPQIVIGPL